MQRDFCDDPRMLAPRRAEVIHLGGGSFELRSPEPLQPYARCVGEWLERSAPHGLLKKVAVDFVTVYEASVGKGSRNQFAGHGYDARIVLEKVLPVALKKAKPGTAEFRVALRDAMENMGRTIFSHGVMNWTKDDHWGYTNETGVLLKVVNGNFTVVK